MRVCYSVYIRWISVVQLSIQILEDAGSAHAAADAHADHAKLDVPALHLVDELGGQLGAGAAEGVPQGDGAAVDVGDGFIQSELRG